MIRCDVMLWKDVCSKGQRMLRAMINAAPAGIQCTVTDGQPTGAPWLMTWGMGHVGRRHYLDRHVAAGGRVIAWDLGYWERQDTFRVTVDHDHPWRLMAWQDPVRFDQRGIVLREDADPAGDILLVAMGKKSDRLFPNWQAQVMARLARKYPGRKVQIRVKAKDPIEPVLVGKSLVVCRHSNVAVDACIAGVPVECEDGAAFALYRYESHQSQPARLEFLRRLAWWQWKTSEAGDAWKFLMKVCGST